MNEVVHPLPLENRVRRNSESDHDKDQAVPSRRRPYHPLIVFLGVLHDQRVGASSAGTIPG
jgi:hypothetical protein